MLRTYEVKYIFSEENKIRFDPSVDVFECLLKIIITDLPHMFAQCSELLSKISTMTVATLKYTGAKSNANT